ncbi:WD40 repeat domain-containing protein [Thiomonas sp.]
MLSELKGFSRWIGAPLRLFLVAGLSLVLLHQRGAFAFDLGETGALLGIQPGGKMLRPYAVIPETFAPTSVALSPDGKFVADVGMYAPIVHVWDIQTKALVRTLSGGGPNADRHAIAWSPDGRYLAVCDGPNPSSTFVTIWNTATWNTVAQLKPGVSWTGSCISPTFNANSTLFAYSDGEGDAFIYSTSTWTQTHATRYGYAQVKDELFKQHLIPTTLIGEQIAFIPHQPKLAIGVNGLFSDNGDNTLAKIRIQDFVSTNRIIVWNLNGQPPDIEHTIIDPHKVLLIYGKQPLLPPNPDYPGAPRSRADPVIDAIGFAPDGKTFATGTESGDVKIWNLNPFDLIAFPLHGTIPMRGEIRTVLFTADGGHLLASKEGSGYPNVLGKIVVIEAKTGAVEETLPVANYGGLAYSGKTSLVAIGSHSLGGYRILIWKFR